MIKFDEFIELASRVNINDYYYSKHVITFAELKDMFKYTYFNFNDIKDSDYIIFERILTGGASGGSCWGDEPRYFTEKHQEPENLDRMFEIIAPNISFMQYKRLTREVDQAVANYSECEYYGNYNEYSIYAWNLNDLYKKVKELNAEK